MARIQPPLTIVDTSGNAVAGASVAITYRAGGTSPTLYTTETGATTTANPATTDANGRVNVWHFPGSFNAAVTATGLTSYTATYDVPPGTVPAARVYGNTHAAIANSATGTLAFNLEDFDTEGIHDTVTNNNRLTCVTPGRYVVSGSVQFTATATAAGRGVPFLTKNGTAIAVASFIGPSSEFGLSAIVSLAAGDYVDMGFSNLTGGSLTPGAGNNLSWLSMAYLGSTL
jgi:hypothetical protein